jgi:putative acetyltransferase
MTNRWGIPNDGVLIQPYEKNLRDQLLTVWERSVVATHHFLRPEDFTTIKALVHTIDFGAFDVYCLLQEKRVLGFLGVAERKVEMLFLDPDYHGKGLGKKLMDFAITELHATLVDVNEQNSEAVRFYERYGFKTYERSERDDQGNPYPLLRMKLESKTK